MQLLVHIKVTHRAKYAGSHPYFEAPWVLLVSRVLFEVAKTNLGHWVWSNGLCFTAGTCSYSLTNILCSNYHPKGNAGGSKWSDWSWATPCFEEPFQNFYKIPMLSSQNLSFNKQ